MSFKFEAELNAAKFKKGLDQVEKSSLAATQRIITGIRRTAQIGISMSQAFGSAIDQSLAMGVEALLLGIEASVAIATGTAGLTTAFQLGAIASMLITIGLIESGRVENLQNVQGAVATFRLLSF